MENVTNIDEVPLPPQRVQQEKSGMKNMMVQSSLHLHGETLEPMVSV